MKNRYPENHKTAKRRDDMTLTTSNLSMSYYCGYVRLPKRNLSEPGYYGILTYAPVHGGLNYAEQDDTDGSMVYGFDCAHADDDNRPELKDEEWLFAECAHMKRCIELAEKFEADYIGSDGDNKKRAEILDAYRSECGEHDTKSFNFIMAMNIMSGSL